MRLLALYLTLGFTWLAYSSQHRPVHNYALIHKPTTFKQRQAAVLKDLWGLSDDEVAKPVNLFGE